MIDSIKKYLPIFFIAFIFAIFSIIGIFILVDVLIFRHNAVKIPAEIVDIYIGHNDDGDRYTDTYVTYEYNERTYNHVLLKGYKGKASVDKQISILCDSKNPRKIYATGSSQFYTPVVLIVIGGSPITLISILCILENRKYDYKRFM